MWYRNISLRLRNHWCYLKWRQDRLYPNDLCLYVHLSAMVVTIINKAPLETQNVQQHLWGLIDSQYISWLQTRLIEGQLYWKLRCPSERTEITVILQNVLSKSTPKMARMKHVLQEKQWSGAARRTIKASMNIAMKAPHKPPMHISWRKREGLDQELLLWERYVRYQKSTELLIRRTPFQWVIYEDHARHQEWPKDPGSGNKRFAGSGRGLFSRPVWRLQPVCYPCKMSHHHAKRCAVSKKNMQREDLEISWPVTQTWSFSGPPTFSKSKYIWKSYLSAFSTKQKGESIESDSSPLNMMETTQEQVDIIALGPNSYLWLKNTAKIRILICTP